MLENLKEQVVATALKAQRSGLCKHKSGNVSVRDPETGYVCVTPSGVDREELTADMVCVLDTVGKVLEGMKPSSESLMHLACYRERPDVFAIVHTHSPMACVFACLNRPIPAFIFELFGFNLDKATIPVAPYGLPGTTQLAENVAETMKRTDLALMERHGAIALGKTPAEAFDNADYIEELSNIYYHILTLNGGKDTKVFTEEDFKAWKYPDQISKK